MTTETTERDLITEVEELLAKATPGPWVWESVGEFDGEASNAGGFTYQHIRAGYVGIADTYHSSGALWPDDSVTPPRNGNVHDANLIAAAPELLRRLKDEVKRLQVFVAAVADLGCLRGRQVHCVEREPQPADWCVACQAKTPNLKEK